MNRYAEYKDSGIEWIGKIPSHWEFGRMKFQLSRNDGGVWGENLENNDEGTIVIRSTEISIDGKWNLSNPMSRSITASEFQKCQLKEGDIVVTKSSGSFKHIGKSVVVSKRIEGLNCCYSNFVQRIRFKRHLPKLYHYILNSYIVREQYRFLTQSTTGLGNLDRSSLDEILLPLIPLNTQFQISQYLDKKTSQIDSLIEKFERKTELLKEQRTTLISQCVTKGLDPNVEMKDSGVEWIGEIPSHWEFGRMKFQLSRNDGGVWGENLENNDEGTIVIRSTEISIDGKWNLSNPMSRSITASEFQKCQLKEGDIVVTKSSGSFKHIGKSVVVSKRIEGLNCCYSNFVQRIRFKRHLPKLYHYILNSYIVREQYRFLTQSTTGLGNLDRSSLDEILLPLIPLNTQFQISQYLDKKTSQIDSLSEKLQRKVELLKEYRNSLISNVVTGKVKVTEDTP